MSEEEEKALKVINARTRRLLDELEIEKEDMLDEPKIAYLMQEIRANKTVLNLIDQLQSQLNEKDNSIKLILKRLENDINRITDKKAEGYTDDYRRCRLKAYRTKTREIKELIEKEYYFGR